MIKDNEKVENDYDNTTQYCTTDTQKAGRMGGRGGRGGDNDNFLIMISLGTPLCVLVGMELETPTV